MYQGNVNIGNIGNIGTIGSTEINYINYGMSGASGTYYNTYGMSGGSGTTNGPSGTYSNVNVYVGPSGTYSNVNINVGASGTFMNLNNNQMLTGNYHSQQYSYDFINGLSKQNVYDKVGINDDDFNFQAGMLYNTKRKYQLLYKNVEFNIIIDINELEDENLICNGEFKKMLKFINLIMDTTDDTRIMRYLKRIIDKDYFINKKMVRSINITI
jgi:hypothetical protein